MKKKLFLVAIGALLLIGMVVGVEAQASPRIYLKPNPLLLEAVNPTGTLEVRLEGVSGISAFDIKLSYDKSKIRIDGLEFPSALGGSTVGPSIDNEGGSITFGAYTFERDANDDFVNILGGQELLATISLTAVGGGDASLSFTRAEILGTTADAGEEPPRVEVSTEDGLVRVGTPSGTEITLHSGGNNVIWPSGLDGLASLSALESIQTDCGSAPAISRKRNGWWESAVYGYDGVGFALSEGAAVYIRVGSGCVWSP